MRIAISQPTFLPWQGYFALIDYVDIFVFLDDVQFIKRSWIQRNKIKSLEKELILTIPIKTKGKRFQKIKSAEIDDQQYDVKKILRSIHDNYKKAQYFEKYFKTIENVLNSNHKYLASLNISLIKNICDLIKIKTEFKKSSEIIGENTYKNINLLEKISDKMNATEYISTKGAKDYMGEINKFPNINTNIYFFDYLQSPYTQLNNNFIPFMSIIDLLFNEGENTLKILRKNFKII